MCATRAAGWKLKGMLAPVAALTFARLRLATPPAVVNVPPSRTDPSVPQTTVSTCPFTLGSKAVILYGEVAEKAKALLRAISAVELGFFTCENLPTAYMVLPHWTICRTSSTDPSFPGVPICGVGGGVEDTDAFATPGDRATNPAASTAVAALRIRFMRSAPVVGRRVAEEIGEGQV